MELFEQNRISNLNETAPLAYRMRPKDFSEFIGQEHIVGANTPLRRTLDVGKLRSFIFYGPPGTGKTALANLIASYTNSFFVPLNAVTAKLEDIRTAIQKAKENLGMYSRQTILFIDEIHRFTKVQQDSLLPDVEAGNIILIGVTTENPYFSIIPALVSRTSILEFKPLTSENLKLIVKKSLADKQNGLGNIPISLDDNALDHLVNLSGGDARIALNILEVAALTNSYKINEEIKITLEMVENAIQKKAVLYDKDGDSHYDTISAFIKSMRGSDPDATIYWLAKMIYAGEDPRFIARRIVICASEDVGNADPMALVVAQSAFTACESIGIPESRIILAQAAIYVACAPKSNSSYLAIDKALQDIENGVHLQVPLHLKSTGYKSASKLNRGKDYIYPHNSPEHFIKQKYLPHDKKYYKPTSQGKEKEIKERLEKLWKKHLDSD
ncbi:replication-associated recombination protein A [Candidatus Poribacteria bacterium]|nr:replication-associated recombination protein A [Candidatus Poribacteria bacterium]